MDNGDVELELGRTRQSLANCGFKTPAVFRLYPVLLTAVCGFMYPLFLISVLNGRSVGFRIEISDFAGYGTVAPQVFPVFAEGTRNLDFDKY